jgi:hypothetical protein
MLPLLLPGVLHHRLLLLLALLEGPLPQLPGAECQHSTAATSVMKWPLQQTQWQQLLQAQHLAPSCLPDLLRLLDQQQH